MSVRKNIFISRPLKKECWKHCVAITRRWRQATFCLVFRSGGLDPLIFIIMSSKCCTQFLTSIVLLLYMSGYRHTTISLICMSTHKAMATRCLSYHQAASRQHAIRALAMAPLRRLPLSVLFTIVTTSYQTTLYSLREIFNKRQHANARYRVEFSHYDSI